MTNRHAATVLALLVVVYVAALVLLAPRLDLLDLPAHVDLLVSASVGVVVASPAFLAIWAVHGRQRASVRVPVTSWLLAAFYLAAVYGEVRYFGRGEADLVLLSGIAWLTAYIVIVSALWLLRAVRGWRLQRVEMMPARDPVPSLDTVRQRQFTIRTLLSWTAAAGALCAGLRWLAPYHALDAEQLSVQLVQGDLIEGAVLGLIFALASLPVVSAAWFVLADGRRMVLRAVLIAITALGIATGIAACRYYLDVSEVEFVKMAVAIEAGVLCAALSAALVVRACGYCLMRPSKVAQASAAPVPPCRFALTSASLAAVSVGLACCAPQRFELWRQADEKERWAGMGWEAGFDSDGRITSMSRTLGQDLSGSQIAGLRDLESLSFSHSQLTDAQLAQYPIQNAALARLTSLDLSDTQIDDAGLPHLAHFPDLTHLNLSQTHITDAGILGIANLAHLERLELAITDLSDEAVESLSRLRQLQSLDLQLTGVSEDGVRRLREALPNATVTYGASDVSLQDALTATVRVSSGWGIAIAQMPKQPKRLHARGGLRVNDTLQAVTPPAVGVTDRGLSLLVGQTELEELDLRDSAVTDAGWSGLPSLSVLICVVRT